MENATQPIKPKKSIMRSIKIFFVCICIFGAWIGGIAMTGWQPFRNFTDKIGLTKPQEITIENTLDYEIEAIENEDGTITIIIKPKGS